MKKNKAVIFLIVIAVAAFAVGIGFAKFNKSSQEENQKKEIPKIVSKEKEEDNSSKQDVEVAEDEGLKIEDKSFNPALDDTALEEDQEDIIEDPEIDNL